MLHRCRVGRPYEHRINGGYSGMPAAVALAGLGIAAHGNSARILMPRRRAQDRGISTVEQKVQAPGIDLMHLP